MKPEFIARWFADSSSRLVVARSPRVRNSQPGLVMAADEAH